MHTAHNHELELRDGELATSEARLIVLEGTVSSSEETRIVVEQALADQRAENESQAVTFATVRNTAVGVGVVEHSFPHGS